MCVGGGDYYYTNEQFNDGMDDEYIEDEKYSHSIAKDFIVDSYAKIYGKIEERLAGENHE